MTGPPFNDRASLTALPPELLLMIYGYTFSDARVRFHSTYVVENRLHDCSIHGQPLALRYVSKFFLTDPMLYREFLRNATVVISSVSELVHLSKRLDPSHRALIRYLCISTHPSIDYTEPRDIPCTKGKCKWSYRDWLQVRLPHVSHALPSLKHLSTEQCGMFIDRFRRCCDFSLEELIQSATEFNKETLGISNMKPGDREILRFSSPFTSEFNSGLISTSPAGIFSKKLADAMIASFKSSRASSCVFDVFWHSHLIRGTREKNIEMTYKMAFILNGDSSSQGEPRVFENITISSKDWIARLEADGKVYEFEQDMLEIINLGSPRMGPT